MTAERKGGLISRIGFSFATDHPDGFGNDDLQLIEAVLPAVSLAIVSDAEHTISVASSI
jgi:hypothetical protein